MPAMVMVAGLGWAGRGWWSLQGGEGEHLTAVLLLQTRLAAALHCCDKAGC